MSLTSWPLLRASRPATCSSPTSTLIGDDWDIAERTVAELGRLGLGHLDLDRTVASLSGGELVLLSVAALLLRRPSILLLDEPTNNLDQRGPWATDRRHRGRGKALFSSSATTASCSTRWTTSPSCAAATCAGTAAATTTYERTVAAEQEAAERVVRSAEAEVRAQKRDLVESQSKLASHARQGRAQAAKGGIPQIVVGGRKRAAQVTAGRVTRRAPGPARRSGFTTRRRRGFACATIARSASTCPPRRCRRDARCCCSRAVRPPHGDLEVDLDVRGPERIGLTGRNGSGKTSLLRTIIGELAPAAGTVDGQGAAGATCRKPWTCS